MRFKSSLIQGVISIHATLAGGDICEILPHAMREQFLSTPPSRVATFFRRAKMLIPTDFYPRHPRGWRLKVPEIPFSRIDISIHATLAGGDGSTRTVHHRRRDFYPRHPRGWRPWRLTLRTVATDISIHATLAGGDLAVVTISDGLHRISIHATLAGGDATTWTTCGRPSDFYPRHPRGWRQFYHDRAHADMGISIHATLAGGDPTW